MEKTHLVSFLVLFFCFFVFTTIARLSHYFPAKTVFDAIEVLSITGFSGMSLTLQIVFQDLVSQSSAITVFAASDEVFKESGQPPQSLLHYHFTPSKYSIESLRSLSFGTEIPTFFENNSLIITTKPGDQEVSLNNVTINGSAIFDVGTMVIYGIKKFFDPSFSVSPISTPVVQNPRKNLQCPASQFTDYREIARYSVFGEWRFFDLLVHKVTIFAPVDGELHNNFTHFSSIFNGHVVPCKLTWKDLADLENGTGLPTFLKAFNLNITKPSEVKVLLNGVLIIFPEAYSDERVVVHGIEKVLELNQQQSLKGDSVSGFPSNSAEATLDYGVRALYCDRRTTIFCLLQLLLIAMSIGLKVFHQRYPQRYIISKWRNVYFLIALVSLEFASNVIELTSHTAAFRSLSLPLAIASLYFTFIEHYHYSQHKSLAHLLLEMGFLFITTQLVLYLRLSELIGEPVMWMEKVSRWVFGISFLKHYTKCYLYICYDTSNDFGNLWIKEGVLAVMISMLCYYFWLLS